MTNNKSGSGPVEQAQGLLNALWEATRNLTYASIGIVGAVSAEAEETYRRSINRGKGRVRKLKRRLPLPDRLKGGPDPVETADGAARDMATEAGQLSQSAAEEWRAMLNRLNLADPADIKALTDKIADLEAKLNELSKPS
jgi:hypothetical protein